RFTSPAEACGIFASSFPVAGLTTSSCCGESLSVHLPPMNSFSGGSAESARLIGPAVELIDTSLWMTWILLPTGHNAALRHSDCLSAGGRFCQIIYIRFREKKSILSYLIDFFS